MRPYGMKRKVVQVPVHERYGGLIVGRTKKTDPIISFAIVTHESITHNMIAKPERMIE